jgi:hypothetical protein
MANHLNRLRPKALQPFDKSVLSSLLIPRTSAFLPPDPAGTIALHIRSKIDRYSVSI